MRNNYGNLTTAFRVNFLHRVSLLEGSNKKTSVLLTLNYVTILGNFELIYHLGH